MNIRFKEKESKKHYFPAHYQYLTDNLIILVKSISSLNISQNSALEIYREVPHSTSKLGGIHPCCVLSGVGLCCGWLTQWVLRRGGSYSFSFSHSLIHVVPKAYPQCDLILNPSGTLLSQGMNDCRLSCQYLFCVFSMPMWEYHINTDMRRVFWYKDVRILFSQIPPLEFLHGEFAYPGLVQEWKEEELEFIRFWVSSWHLLGHWLSSPSGPVWEHATQLPFLTSQLHFQCKSNCLLLHFCSCYLEGQQLLQVLSISF